METNLENLQGVCNKTEELLWIQIDMHIRKMGGKI
jgi:hypothetical protein